jgi:hypothetical protein
MRIRGGEFSTGTMGNFQPELTNKTGPPLGDATQNLSARRLWPPRRQWVWLHPHAENGRGENNSGLTAALLSARVVEKLASNRHQNPVL